MTNESNPMNQIEDEKAMIDMGIMGFRVMKGALSEGASIVEAFLVTSAYFRGMFGNAVDNTENEEK